MAYLTKWDKVFGAASWLIVIVLIYAAATIWVYPPPPDGPVRAVAGLLYAQIFYTVLFSGQALMLFYAQIKKRKKFRKHTLLFIYLTGFFTTILAYGLMGADFRLIDNFVVSVLSAGCWLYWKFKTEYISSKQFAKDVEEYRRDYPHNHHKD